jgi:hypothetical protein
MSVDAFASEALGGSVDGTPFVVVAWMPEPYELARLNDGHPIFLTCMGGLPPHFLSTTFEQATNPA